MSPQARKPSSRYAGRISIFFLLWMMLFAVIAGAGGVTYAIFKNHQVAEKTAISKMQREIAVCRMNANQYRAKTNAQTNRWAMRSRLQSDSSSLRDINRHQIEVARSLSDTERLSATAAR